MHTHNGNGKSRINGLHIAGTETDSRTALPAPNSTNAAALLAQNGNATALPEAIIPLLAWRQRITLLAGREKKAGKTTLAATAAAKLTSGGTHLGQRLTPAPVLWTIAEGHYGDVLRTMQDAGADLAHVQIHNQLGTQRLAQLESNISHHRPAVTFIDTLASFTDDRITNAAGSDNWVSIMNTLTRFAQQYDCAIVIIAHTRKDDEEVRDSTAIAAGADMILMITGHRQNNTRRITAQGRWHVDHHTITLDGAEYRFHVEEQHNSHSSHEQKVRQYLADHPGASKYATRKAVGGSNQATDTAYNAINAEAGLQAGPQAGLKSRKYHA